MPTFQVPISRGSSRCTLGAVSRDQNARLTVQVIDPNKGIVSADSRTRMVESAQYSFCDITDPVPGTWTIRADADSGDTGDGTVRVIAFEVNDQVSLNVSLLRPHVRVGDDIEIRATLGVPFVAPGVRFTALVRLPSGRERELGLAPMADNRDDASERFVAKARLSTTGEEPGRYEVTVTAELEEGEVEIDPDPIHPPRRSDAGAPAPLRRQVPAVTRRTTVSALVSQEGPKEDDVRPGWSSEPFVMPERPRSL